MPWEPLYGKEREPTGLAAPLDELLTKLSGVSRSAIEVVMDHWSDIVGDAAAAVSDPVKVADGVVTVRVDDSTWASEFRWLEATVLERIADLTNGTAPDRMKVVVRPR